MMLLIAGCCLVMGGCSTVRLSIAADKSVNRDINGTPSPVAVRIIYFHTLPRFLAASWPQLSTQFSGQTRYLEPGQVAQWTYRSKRFTSQWGRCMSELTQVVWHEGLFLKANHFQHQHRFQHAYAAQHFQQQAYPAWGWQKLKWEVRPHCLVITEAQGCCRDGTPIVIAAECPLEILIPKDTQHAEVFIGLPTEASVPFVRQTQSCLDRWAETPSSAQIEVAIWAWQGTVEVDSLHLMQRLPVAVIESCQSSGHQCV